MSKYKVFAINPGSTSTKIALFEDDYCVFTKNVAHDSNILKQFKEVRDQLDYRKETILGELQEEGISLKGTNAFVGRGGSGYSMAGGTYVINEQLVEDMLNGVGGTAHPANLGAKIADDFAKEFGAKAFLVNPPCVDEFEDVARITGMEGVFRKSQIHALNQKETAIRHANSVGKKYEDCNFVVAHLGGGISVAAHKKGKMIDGNDAAGGEGPMTPTRCGEVAVASVVRICYSGEYTEKEMLSRTAKSGGFSEILSTSDAREVTKRIAEGDKKAALYWEGMLYQITKAIGAMSAVLKGKVDGILLGGGMVHDKGLVSYITEACSYIAPVSAYPGEFEMEAMASGAIRVMEGTEKPVPYNGKPVWDGFDF